MSGGVWRRVHEFELAKASEWAAVRATHRRKVKDMFIAEQAARTARVAPIVKRAAEYIMTNLERAIVPSGDYDIGRRDMTINIPVAALGGEWPLPRWDGPAFCRLLERGGGVDTLDAASLDLEKGGCGGQICDDYDKEKKMVRLTLYRDHVSPGLDAPAASTRARYLLIIHDVSW